MYNTQSGKRVHGLLYKEKNLLGIRQSGSVRIIDQLISERLIVVSTVRRIGTIVPNGTVPVYTGRYRYVVYRYPQGKFDEFRSFVAVRAVYTFL